MPHLARRMASQARKGFGMYEHVMASNRPSDDIIHLHIGRPHHDTPEHIKTAVKQALDAGIVHYGELSGLGRLREVLAQRYTHEHDTQYTPDEILITNGVTQASFAAFLALIDDGDEVIVLDPFYPQHNSKIELASGRVIAVPLAVRDGLFRLDAVALERAVTPRTRMVVLINPSNPTGAVYTREELQQLADIVARHNLLVLADEVYEFITYDSQQHIVFASLPGMKERTVTVSAFTKAYAMDGWRIGYAAAPKPIIAELRKITMNATTHPNVFAQEGAYTAVVSSQRCVREMVASDRISRDLVVSGFNSVPGVRCGVPQGTIYALPDLAVFGIDSSELAIRIFDQTGVAMEAGTFYGQQSRYHLRVCFGSEPPARVAEAMKRVTAYLTSGDLR